MAIDVDVFRRRFSLSFSLTLGYSTAILIDEQLNWQIVGKELAQSLNPYLCADYSCAFELRPKFVDSPRVEYNGMS